MGRVTLDTMVMSWFGSSSDFPVARRHPIFAARLTRSVRRSTSKSPTSWGLLSPQPTSCFVTVHVDSEGMRTAGEHLNTGPDNLCEQLCECRCGHAVAAAQRYESTNRAKESHHNGRVGLGFIGFRPWKLTPPLASYPRSLQTLHWPC